jgi:preprotein translocase subunit SecA
MAGILQLKVPDLAVGVYAERDDKDKNLLDQFALRVARHLRKRIFPPIKNLNKRVYDAENLADVIKDFDDQAIRKNLRTIAAAIVRDPRHPDLSKGLALVREAAKRSLGIMPYPTQLKGATALLEGRLAEMQTGEGKTLTAGLAACLAGVAGLPTHVVTVNDYLAQRDAEKIGPLFAFFELTVGSVINGMSPDQKRAAYSCHVTYCTNKELVFDYLRDRVTAGGRASRAQIRVRAMHGKHMQPLLLRGLHFAIVDETDSILIDEARTPLILSVKAGSAPDPELYLHALKIAEAMDIDEHYTINSSQKLLLLKPSGKSAIAELSKSLGGIWQIAQAREHLIGQALRALHLFERDHHYLLADDQIHIIDEYTGRILPGRKWEQGLHQMIEAKEGCALSEPVETLARITYQRFFCRYLRLSGMTGTAKEVAKELQQTYNLEVITIPTYKPCLRITTPEILCASADDKWQRVLKICANNQNQGRAVLIGTRSVHDSECLSQVLFEAGVPHQVLNARQDEEEADIIANAGLPGTVTVATNMAGRGTDIGLHPQVIEKGGLTVILTEYHESARIDRQLVGRCARQGDPGECIAVIAFTDPLFREHGGWFYKVLNRYYSSNDPEAIPPFLIQGLRRYAQIQAESMNVRIRRDTLKQDRNLDNTLAFAGNQI